MAHELNKAQDHREAVTMRGVRTLKVSIHIVALIALLISGACTQRSSDVDEPIVHSHRVPPVSGEVGLNERIMSADVIARAKLRSTHSTAELVQEKPAGQDRYQGLVHFTFDVLEYLKGFGGTEITAFATVDLRSDVIERLIQISAEGGYIDWLDLDDSNPYDSKESALEAADQWEIDRDRSWDHREAIIMVSKVSDESGVLDRYFLGPIFSYDINSKHKVWLPITTLVLARRSSTDGDASESEESRYFLEAPPSGVSTLTASDTSTEVETISVGEMKSLIQELDQWKSEGEGDWEYEQCIWETFYDERDVNATIELRNSAWMRMSYSLESVAPFGTQCRGDPSSRWRNMARRKR